jgi:hypothetical protein
MKEQTGMAKKNKASSLDTPACQLATITPIALTVPQRSQREITSPDGDSGSYQLAEPFGLNQSCVKQLFLPCLMASFLTTRSHARKWLPPHYA